jgi:hypothetical protein
MSGISRKESTDRLGCPIDAVRALLAVIEKRTRSVAVVLPVEKTRRPKAVGLERARA